MTKKDTNYVASVEKAIAEKYGTETVQDFRSTWDPEKERKYLKELKKRRVTSDKTRTERERVEISNVLISKRAINKKSNRTCNVCKTYSFSYRDDLYMNRFECCYLCFIDFVDRYEDRWKDGWRPDEETVLHMTRRRKKWQTS